MLIVERNKKQMNQIIKLTPNQLVRFKRRNTDLNFTPHWQIYILYRIMTSIISFMTSILFCRTCWKCDGLIDCPSLSPHDEANCSQQCSTPWSGFIPCDCNKLGNMTCTGSGGVCYRTSGNFLVLFYFVNGTMTNFGNVTIAVK